MLMPIVGISILVIGPMIYFEDKGTIFYKAQRRGYKGEVFEMLKFRSMKMNAPDIRNKDNSTYNSPNDPRVTKIGKILRKSSLDEIPQLINIFKGICRLLARDLIPQIRILEILVQYRGKDLTLGRD